MKRFIYLLAAMLCTTAFAQSERQGQAPGSNVPAQGAAQLPSYMSTRHGPASSIENALRFRLQAFSHVAAQDDGSIGVVLALSERLGVPYNDVAKFLLEDVPASFEQLEVDRNAHQANYCRTPLETIPSEHAARMQAVRQGRAAALVKWARELKSIAPPLLWEDFVERASNQTFGTLTIDHEARASDPDWSVAEFRSKFCVGF